MRTEWEFSNEDGKLDRQYGEEPFKKGIAGNYTPRTEEEWQNLPEVKETPVEAIPDTDLVRIAERDVIERAKDWAADRRNWTMANGRLEDNLLAAVALLESREQPAPKNVPESDSGPAVALSKTFTHGFDAPEASYRIEKRNVDNPLAEHVEYWYADGLGRDGGFWTISVSAATIYTEAERTEFLNKTLRGEPSGFPEGGIWVRELKGQ